MNRDKIRFLSYRVLILGLGTGLLLLVLLLILLFFAVSAERTLFVPFFIGTALTILLIWGAVIDFNND